MSLAVARPSSAIRLSPDSLGEAPHTRSTRRNPATPSSPSDSFANLDPQLHPATLNSAQDRDLSPQAENRLNDFAQHVLGANDDASNLLAFTASEDGGLFGPDQNPQFEGLLENERAEEEGEGQGDYVPEETGQDENAVAETPGGRARGGGRKRNREGEEGENGTTDPAKAKKDSHKEVERRRRETINDGIGDIARLVPGGVEKVGKGTLLRRAADHMAELTEKVARYDAEIAKREMEKGDIQTELSHVQSRLADEHSRSIRYETSWREAEDRAASSQFELERVRSELEALRK